MKAEFGNPEAVKRVIETIQSRLGVSPATQLQVEVEAGLHPNLLARGGKLTSGSEIPAIEKYLIGSNSFLRQPIQYYDIFAAARCVLMTQLLGEAIEVIDVAKITTAEDRLKRLLPLADPDVYESALLELIAGARYAATPTVDRVDFIPEQATKTPDFVVRRGTIESFVECKKVVRVRRISDAIRQLVRERLSVVLSHFQKRGISVLFEINFTSDPSRVSEHELLQACQAAFEEKTAIVTPGFVVMARTLQRFEHDGPILFPSPRFNWLRYQYRVRSDWFGLVHNVVAKPALLTAVPKELRGGISTWILSVDWDAAVKWKISSADVVGKYRRFAFDGVFDALGQINSAGKDSTVHVWIETDYFVGHRNNVMLDLHARLNRNPNHTVGWIVLNETLLDVSPLGNFDLIEHAHIISGPTATSKEPIVSGLFGGIDESKPLAEFGIGTELPDIDAQ